MYGRHRTEVWEWSQSLFKRHINGYDNSIVSWVLSHSNNNKPVMDTLKKAYKKNPGVTPLLQSDRGFQYTSHEYHRLHVKYEFMKSMSRESQCLDNQPIEQFWGTYKSESYYLTKFHTYEDVLNDVSEYILYYNKLPLYRVFGWFVA